MKQILTPNHLYFGCELNVENVSGKYDANNLTDLNKQVKYINNLLNRFWNHWYLEYVLSFANTRSSPENKQYHA